MTWWVGSLLKLAALGHVEGRLCSTLMAWYAQPPSLARRLLGGALPTAYFSNVEQTGEPGDKWCWEYGSDH